MTHPASAPTTGASIARARSGWLNHSTVGIALASLCSDVSHELATAVLPVVLLALGSGPAALGVIEGFADGLSALAKLWGGIVTDRLTRRKPLASVGYLVTALGTAAIGACAAWWQILLCRVAAWIGRGSRSPARDVLMAEAAEPAVWGRAFGMERAGDALGAVLGPLLALALIAAGVQPQHVMIWSLAPGLLAFLAITLLVVERPRAEPVAPRRTFRAHLTDTTSDFRRYLTGILIFGCGDFSRTLLILYVTQHGEGAAFHWQGATLAMALYVLHNAVSTVAAFPIGVLCDRIGRQRVVTAGYLFAGATTVGFALLPARPLVLVGLFVCSGVYIACEEVAEKARASELLDEKTRGTGMGLLAATDGIGDMVSSVLIGVLWSLSPGRPALGFIAAASLQLAGALVIGAGVRDERPGGSRHDA
jgi:MFS family permease